MGNRNRLEVIMKVFYAVPHSGLSDHLAREAVAASRGSGGR
jgi:hypothetical protein